MLAQKIILGETATELAKLAARSVDVVYWDPPFGNQQDWTGKAGSFSDRWGWDEAAAARHSSLGGLGVALCTIGAAQSPAMRGYMMFMAEALVAVRRVMALHAVLFLHCDDTAGDYLRIACDMIFGAEHGLGKLIWKRTTAHADANNWGRVHDTIHVIARHRRGAEARAWRFESIADVLTERLASTSAERVGYPTQKPVALIERLIASAARRGEVLLDPMCGSGTALVAARRRGLGFIGIDRNPDAVALARERTAPPQQADLFAA
jgi:site-specific DNA-methyltransferase (adenine-specific)